MLAVEELYFVGLKRMWFLDVSSLLVNLSRLKAGDFGFAKKKTGRVPSE